MIFLKISRPNQQGGNTRSAGIPLNGSKQKESNAYLKSLSSGGHPASGGDDCRVRDNHHGVSSPLGTAANNGMQSVIYPASHQQYLPSTSHKRSLNNLDLKGKKGMIGKLFMFLKDSDKIVFS